MRRLGVALALGLAGCEEPTVRPELVLSVDIDMPVSSQASDEISPDAIFDSLRIEVRDPAGTLIDARVFSIASADSLPIAFGIRGDADLGGHVDVSVRAFRAGLAESGELRDEPVLDPRPEVSVDRLVSLALPSEGLVEKSILLSGDCIGIPSHFGINGGGDTTCIDAARPEAPSSDGIEDGRPSATLSGSWGRATVIECDASLAPPPATRCIPGGFAILGDPLFLAHNELERDALPLVPVSLPPFFMDETEVTVGALRALIADGYAGPVPAEKTADTSDCTWAPDSDPSLPLNCIRFEVADAVCAARGGRVPSEARWEHAARGRGERSIFVWGEAVPACCTTSIGYFPGGGCTPFGLEPVGSHPISDDCAGDVSRDGIRDLNGSVSELVTDSIARFSDACWSPPGASAILDDPSCDGTPGRMSRGGSWDTTIGSAALPIRRSFIELDPGHGFRCVYEAQ